MYPFRNLAFQGGGAKAFAYHGAIRVLEEQGVLRQIERVAGTSAGSTLAALLSMRLDADEIVHVFRSFDYDGFNTALSGRTSERGLSPRLLGRLQGNISAVSRMATRYGWFSLDHLHDWLQGTLAAYCKGYEKATFGQFRSWGFRDLYIVATNVTRRRAQVFSADTTPDVAVVDALIMSQSIPLFFEGLQFDGRHFGQGDHYADGGMMLNYPLPIFDERPFAQNNRWFVNGINWESLGCRLHTPADCQRAQEPIGNLLGYIHSTFESLTEAQAVAYELSKATQRRTINISDCGVNTTDFSIRPLPDDTRYQQLVRAGESATAAYLADYNPPLIKPVFPFSHYIDRTWRRYKKRSAQRTQDKG